MRVAQAVARRSRDDRGFTLPELLIATVLAMMVIGAAVTIFTAGIRSQPRVDTQAAAIQQARVAMENMIRELRQGSSVPSATASQLAVVTYVHNATCGTTTPQCRVTYTCATSGTCTRVVSRPDGTSPAAPARIVSGLATNNVFTYAPPTTTTPASVGVVLAFPGEGGGNAITLSDSATLRNRSGS
jgi:type II secretory pathway pseudopilin PulG